MNTNLIGVGVSIDEVSQRTGYSPDTLRAMVQRGKLQRFANGMFSAGSVIDSVLSFESDATVRQRVTWWRRELEGEQIPEEFKYFTPEERSIRERAAVEASKSDVERYIDRAQVVFDCVATVDQRNRDIAVYEQEIERNKGYLSAARESLAQAETVLRFAIADRDRYKSAYEDYVKSQVQEQSDEPQQPVAEMHREDKLDIRHEPVRRATRRATVSV